MSPIQWVRELIIGKKPTPQQEQNARERILSEIQSSLDALSQMPDTRRNRKTKEQLAKLKHEIATHRKNIKELKKYISELERVNESVHRAAMMTSHRVAMAQSHANITKAALRARAIINRRVRVHLIRERKRGRASRRRGVA